jgi:hypothetical protein
MLHFAFAVGFSKVHVEHAQLVGGCDGALAAAPVRVDDAS